MSQYIIIKKEDLQQRDLANWHHAFLEIPPLPPSISIPTTEKEFEDMFPFIADLRNIWTLNRRVAIRDFITKTLKIELK